MNLPYGVVVTPTSWSHIANELLLKTKFRDWLDKKIGDNWLGGLVVEVVNRLNLRFSDAENGFAALIEDQRHVGSHGHRQSVHADRCEL